VAAADVYSHDLYSREVTREVTEKYNAHMEQCNRAFETADAGEGRPGWGDSQLDNVRAELQRVSAQLEATTQERNKLQEELRQKSAIVSDLSLRLDALSRKINANTRPDRDELAPNGKDNGAVVVGHINRLQEELYAERQKNKRLKGS
jgi:chromosome segregation ATPase